MGSNSGEDRLEQSRLKEEILEKINHSASIDCRFDATYESLVVTPKKSSKHEIMFDSLSSVCLIPQDRIYDFLTDMEGYYRETGDVPEYSPRKMSDSRGIDIFHLIRYDDSRFMVFNRYLRPIEKIPSIEGWEFEKVDLNDEQTTD